MKTGLLFILLSLGLCGALKAEFLPSTAKLIDEVFGAGNAARLLPGGKTLRMKFAKEELWDLAKIRSVCEANHKTCPNKEKRYQKFLKKHCAEDKRSCRKEKTAVQILLMCEAHKTNCLKSRTKAVTNRRAKLPKGVPVARITIDMRATVKILFMDEKNKKRQFAEARLVVIFENLSKKYDRSPPSHQISSKLIMDANLFDVSYISLRLPAIKLCEQPLNLVTVLLHTRRGLFHSSRAFFIPAACHYDFQ